MRVARLFTLFAFMVGSLTTAHAADIKAAKEAKYDLTDVLSPEEIVYEMEIPPPSFKDFLWKASAENPRLHIVINKANKGKAPGAQTLEVYLDGTFYVSFIVSTGKEVPVRTTSGSMSSRRTPVGTYRIHYRSRNHVSKTWVGASMPFAQFFNGGIAIHATTPNHFNELGQRDSGGCVRLHPRDAKVMWDLVGNVGVSETLITVYDGTLQAHPYGGGQSPVMQVPAPTDKDIPDMDSEFESEQAERDATAAINKKEADRVSKERERAQREYQRAKDKYERELREYRAKYGSV